MRLRRRRPGVRGSRGVLSASDRNFENLADPREWGKTYLRLLGQDLTVNQLNKVHISFENRMTPAEQQVIVAHLRELGLDETDQPDDVFAQRRHRLLEVSGYSPVDWMTASESPQKENLQEWSRRWKRDISLSGSDDGEDLRRAFSTSGVTIFSRESTDNNLLVCFTGAVNRMGLPTPNFLRCVPRSIGHIVFLRATKPPNYDDGVGLLGPTFLTAMDSLEEWLQSRDYPAVNTIGSSAGALPAVLAGVRLGARSVVAVGPSHPNRFSIKAPILGKWSFEKSLRLLASGSVPRVSVHYGDLAPQDVEPATRLAELFGEKPSAIPNSRHIFFHRLYELGTLGSFLEEHLL